MVTSNGKFKIDCMRIQEINKQEIKNTVDFSRLFSYTLDTSLMCICCIFYVIHFNSILGQNIGQEYDS